jgi:hypothetical protein
MVSLLKISLREGFKMCLIICMAIRFLSFNSAMIMHPAHWDVLHINGKLRENERRSIKRNYFILLRSAAQVILAYFYCSDFELVCFNF